MIINRTRIGWSQISSSRYQRKFTIFTGTACDYQYWHWISSHSSRTRARRLSNRYWEWYTSGKLFLPVTTCNLFILYKITYFNDLNRFIVTDIFDKWRWMFHQGGRWQIRWLGRFNWRRRQSLTTRRCKCVARWYNYAQLPIRLANQKTCNHPRESPMVYRHQIY